MVEGAYPEPFDVLSINSAWELRIARLLVRILMTCPQITNPDVILGLVHTGGRRNHPRIE